MIKWNEVTWYSRLGALILFLAVLPVLTFYIGTQYQLSITDSEQPVMVGNLKAHADAQITWKFADAGETDGNPYTSVTVVVNGAAHPIGKFIGSCSQLGPTGGIDGKGLLAGELSAAQCWYAGGGDEIGVFAKEDGGSEIMVGGLSETEDGGPMFRGDFKIRSDIQI